MDDDVIQRMLSLSQLALEEKELQQLRSDLDAIIGFIEIMNAVPTEDVAPLSHAVELAHKLRSDEPSKTVDLERFQAVAPEVAEGLYLVPKVLEQR